MLLHYLKGSLDMLILSFDQFIQLLKGKTLISSLKMAKAEK
ncbi:hypothetical protein ACFQZX_00660 [Mucilaginibacter litoreus]|uniref:Uncharacterized protein n=1 Tax=Mucilaginibacter litoreus TaxID=1048221 RepID=A0ABW3AN09_9SPHI